MYKHETIRNRLIGYLTLIVYWLLEIWNNQSINWLFGESARH